jgi:hypothetical protein
MALPGFVNDDCITLIAQAELAMMTANWAWLTSQPSTFAGPRRCWPAWQGWPQPSAPVRAALGLCRFWWSAALLDSGRFGEALPPLLRARAILEPLGSAPGAPAEARKGLARTLNGIGVVLTKTGRPMEAEAEYRAPGSGTARRRGRASSPSCSRAPMPRAGLAGQPASGVLAVEGASEADAAMAQLRKAVPMGYCSPDAYRTEDALDPLRDRPGFWLLMMNLAFPAEPFAQ